ncbi:MAG: hypothetical protein JWR52_2721 [Marmoricola sp.]|nr:hypothetical protein [Marmoricola sp.]
MTKQGSLARWTVPMLTLGAMLLTGCTGALGSATGAGTVRGLLPLCYGLGPDTNLRPHVVVEAVGADGVVRRHTFAADQKDHRFYEWKLPQGHYRLTANDARAPISVDVKTGVQSRADFQSQGCL